MGYRRCGKWYSGVPVKTRAGLELSVFDGWLLSTATARGRYRTQKKKDEEALVRTTYPYVARVELETWLAGVKTSLGLKLKCGASGGDGWEATGVRENWESCGVHGGATSYDHRSARAYNLTSRSALYDYDRVSAD